MKKIVFSISGVVIAIVLLIGAFSSVQAQTTTVACPVGYTCIPQEVPNCPQGYVCVPTETENGTEGGGSSSTPNSCYQFVSNLGVGSRGAEVAALQSWLIAHGFSISTTNIPTGYYGIGTANAVKAFQASKGLPATGFVGPLTRAALNVCSTTGGTVTCPVGYICNNYIHVTSPSNGETLQAGIPYKVVWNTNSLDKDTFFDITEFSDDGKGLIIEGIDTTNCTNSNNIYICTIEWSPSQASTKAQLAVQKRDTGEVGYSGSFVIRASSTSATLSAKLISSDQQVDSDATPDRGTFIFKLRLTAANGDVVISKKVSTNNGFIYKVIQGNIKSVVGVVSTSNAESSGDSFIIRDGYSKDFTVTLVVEPAQSGFVVMGLDTIIWSSNDITKKTRLSYSSAPVFLAADAPVTTGGVDPKPVVSTTTSSGSQVPTITIEAKPSVVSRGETFSLIWSSTNATSCTFSGIKDEGGDLSGYYGPIATSGRFDGMAVENTTTAIITCTGAGGTVTKTAVIEVAGETASIQPTVLSANVFESLREWLMDTFPALR